MNDRPRRFEMYAQPAAVAEPRGAGPSSTDHPVAAAFRWLEDTLADHPKSSLIAAISAGALLGWIVKRR